ncbi:hypothetical protein PHYBOEH_004953 [Phytophthora boehmeriae]|uniref:Fe2OG dioxygenase domain-containing protein n=1 Tax=Phytophthora boehmeriae TaxID=109152 RepID=A0A8T1WN33_9STRA|nr:hypothetical protein PHYBOEH_004953 [Phytophthora boehmeriae]
MASARRSKRPPTASSSSSWLNGSWLVVALLAIAAAVFARDSQTLRLALNRVLLETAEPSAVDCSDAHQYLTDVMPVKGFHVLCIKRATDYNRLTVTGFRDGMLSNRSVHVEADLAAFTRAVESEMLQLPPPSDEYARQFKQPAAYFTPDGEPVEKKIEELQDRVVFLFEGGQFIWPGVRIGHKTLVKDTFGRGDLEMETISMTPLVFSVEEFLRDDEIDVILDLSMPHLAPSGVTLQDGHENRPATDWRTSTTYWLESSSHRTVQDIDRRTADLVKVPISHQESVQVLRYEKTQHYDQHLDYFAVDRHRNSPDVLKQIEYGHKNRMITVFWYMSDVVKGGHTNFARAGGLPPPPSNKGCTQGISVAPKKRKVVVFYSMLPNGEGDPTSLHAGCPVEEGIKFSGNKWVWNKPRLDDE